MLSDELKYTIIEMDDFERRKWKKISKIILKRIRKKLIGKLKKDDKDEKEESVKN